MARGRIGRAGDRLVIKVEDTIERDGAAAMIELAADLLVAFLLVLTTSWCVLLYRRLDRLRVERSDIETFLAAVDGAVAPGRAGGRRHPRRRRSKRSALLAAEQEQAQQRIAELTRLVDSAGRMARRVETRHPSGRQRPWPRTASSASAAPHGSLADGRRGQPALPSAGDEPRERPARPQIDAELLKALEALR